ncbi:hypothetical protein FOL54_00015 [Bartonella quintana]|nr:hypothetical protein FOL54_00015 [Bartonella quintana]
MNELVILIVYATINRAGRLKNSNTKNKPALRVFRNFRGLLLCPSSYQQETQEADLSSVLPDLGIPMRGRSLPA